MNKAAAICFNSLTHYLTPHSQYIDAYYASIQVATDLYGENSTELLAVCSAWNSVGVGDNCSTNQQITLDCNTTNLYEQSVIDLTWSSMGDIENVRILYGQIENGDTTWFPIAQQAPNTGSFIWTVPNAPATGLIRIHNAANEAIADTSCVFSINSCGVVAGFQADSTNICEGSSITFTNTSIGVNTYEWFINGNSAFTQQDLSFTFNNAGEYQIRLVAGNGVCSYSYEEIITVSGDTDASNFSYTNTGNTIQFRANVPNENASFSWDFGDTTTSTARNPVHTYERDSIYEVCLIVTNVCGSSEEFCRNIIPTEGSNTDLCAVEWEQFTNGDHILDLLEDGEYMWVGTVGGGLVKLHKETGETIFYNTANSGLPSNRIHALALDTTGTLWIGTYGGGLVSYDGSTWQVFNTSNSGLPSNYVFALSFDTDGTLWIGTNDGLANYDGSSWQVFNTDNSGLSGNYIITLSFDTDGTLWIGASFGLASYDGSTWEVFDIANLGVTYNSVYALSFDTDGTLWVGMAGQGLASYDGSTWQLFTMSNSGLPHNTIYALSFDTDGMLWIGTGEGLARYDGSIWQISNSGFTYNGVFVLSFDIEGRLWIGTDNGLINYDESTWQLFNTSNSGLPHHTVNALSFDTDGTLWIGTEINGLASYDGNSWEVFNSSNSGLFDGPIRVLSVDTDGTLWIGTWGGGLVSYDGSTWETFNTSNSGLPDNVITALAFDTDGTLWIGTETGGLVSYDGSSWQVFNTSNSDLPHNNVSALSFDIDGTLWIGTESGGLASYDGSTWQVFNTDNSGLPHNLVYALSFDTNGTLWIGTDGSLASYDGSTWQVFNMSNFGFPNNRVKTLSFDTDGTLWVGTLGGLASYNGSTWQVFNTDNSGLPTNHVRALSFDTDGTIWIGTYGSLAHFAPDIQSAFNFTISCQSDTTYFQNTSNSASYYEWQINNQTISTTENLNYEFPTSGEYIVTLIASNNSCTEAFTDTITIPARASELNLLSYITNCHADTVVLYAGFEDYAEYTWHYENDSIGNTANITVIDIGQYILEITDSCGNTASDTIQVIFDEDCVYPGDINKDSIVNLYDVLDLGFAFGNTGATRLGADIDFRGQACTAWDSYILDDLSPNAKHADTDGNGVVNILDSTAIHRNYNETRGAYTLPPTLSGTPIELVPVLSQSSISPDGLELNISIELHHAEGGDIALHGLAYRLMFNSLFFVSESADLSTFSNLSFIGEEGLSFQQHFPYYSDITMTRTDGQNAIINSGQGVFVPWTRPIFHGTITATQGDVPSSDTTYCFIISTEHILALNSTGDTIPISGGELQVCFHTDENGDFRLFSSVVEDATCEIGGSITIMPADTLADYNYQWSTGATTSSVSNLPSGSYSVTITTDTSTSILHNIIVNGVSEFITFIPSPSNLMLNTSGNESELSWESNENLFVVQYSIDGGEWTYLLNTTSTIVSFPDTILGNACYRVIATDECFHISEASNIECITGVGISEYFTSIQVFPNPTNGELYIDYDIGMADLELKIYDVLGRQVHYQELQSGQQKVTMDMSAYARGLYIIQLVSEGQVIHLEKVVKE